MKVSHTWLGRYFDKPIPAADKLAELFTFHSFEVEYYTDAVLDLKILPDRAHSCLSHRGVAEEIAVLTKTPLKKRQAGNSTKGIDGVSVSLERRPAVTIEDPAFCPRFTARFVENISPDQSAGQASDQSSPSIASLLVSIGERSISPAVDITNFVMFDIGQPTHAFDADKIVGDIVIRAAKAGEKITLLDGKEYVLTEDDHVIADAAGALDIAGVKGGKRAEVTPATCAVLLTSANFHPAAVRRTSTRLNIRNEASKRFENEITAELAPEGMDILSSLLAAASPTARFGPIIDQYPVKAVQKVITLDPSYINERLGIEVPRETMRDILERMGVSIVEKKLPTSSAPATEWSLTIPFRRLDLVIPEDIVEEVGRIYGYEHIVGTLPGNIGKNAPGKDAPVSFLYLIERIKDALAEADWSEVYLYTLGSKGDVSVAHPQASNKAFLRTNLAAGLGACLESNVRNAELIGLETVKIFEIGKVFSKSSEKNSENNTAIAETLVLALAAAPVKKVKGRDGKVLVSEALKKIAEVTGRELAVKSLLSSGPSAVCEVELTAADFPHENSRTILTASAVPTTPGISALPRISYKPFSPYPFIVRDIAVFVPETAATEGLSGAPETDVWAEIEKGIADAAAADILVRHSLFDTFKKDAKVSYAFRLVFQSMTKTLTDPEVNAVMEKIYARMSTCGWQVR